MYLQNLHGIPPPGCFKHFKEVDLSDEELMGGERCVHEGGESAELTGSQASRGSGPDAGAVSRGVYRSASG